MPPLVFDFTNIASRLRKDDFYTPTPKTAEPVHVGVDLAKPDSDHTMRTCPRCGGNKIEMSIIPNKGAWWCGPCKDWFS